MRLPDPTKIQTMNEYFTASMTTRRIVATERKREKRDRTIASGIYNDQVHWLPVQQLQHDGQNVALPCAEKF